MAYPTLGPGYSGTFIPEIWSTKVIRNFIDSTVAGVIANTDYEGEIRNKGDTVQIRTTPIGQIHTYTDYQTLEVDTPNAPNISLNIDEGEYYNFDLSFLAKRQFDSNYEDKWVEDATSRLKVRVDQRLLAKIMPDVDPRNRGATAGARSKRFALGTSSSAKAVTKDNLIDLIVNMGAVLDEANAPEMDRYLIISPLLGTLIKRSDLRDASVSGDMKSMMRNGRLGVLDRFTLYTSQNLVTSGSGATTVYSILGGHKYATTFAMQMLHTDRVKPSESFSERMRGLQVWGSKVTKPEALCAAYVSVANNAIN